MHHFIFANKDATIYRDYPTQNTGKDEILEIIKGINSASLDLPDLNVYSRVLLNFDLTAVSKSIVNGEITSPRFYLNMHVCRVEGQEQASTLYIYPVSRSWVQGTGKRFDDSIRTYGASWTASDGEVPTYWSITGSDYISGSDVIPVTASLWSDEYNFQNSGQYTYQLSDLRADVSNIVNDWLSGSYSNYGFLIKRSLTEEQDTKSYGFIQFYSTDTHTVYNPTLEVAWNDSVLASTESLVTASLTASDATDLYIYTRDLKDTYNNREKVRVRLGVRQKYPTKSYAYSDPRILNHYLPTSSYYSLIDGDTLETIIPFDTGSTKLSCDTNGNYLNLWMSGLHPERFYQLRIKVVSGSVEQVVDIPTIFKVAR